MQKVRVPINSFQYGEISDSLIMRTDSPVYGQSAQRLENLVVTPEGAVQKRGGLNFLYSYGLTYDSSHEQSHLFRFIFDSNEEYIISIEHQKVRCFRVNDGSAYGLTLVSTLTQDVDSAALPFDEDYLQQYTAAQYGDVMFISHPLFAPRVLVRTSLTSFEINTYSFDTRADNKVTYQPYSVFHSSGVTLDPSAVSGSGITLTTSSDYWVADHVGTTVRYHKSEITITGYTSATVVTGNVVDTLVARLAVLNPLRTREGSNIVEVTQIDHGFNVGDAITVQNASATGGINTGNLNITDQVREIIDDNTYTYQAGGNASSSEDGGGQVSISCHAPTTTWDEQSFSAVRGYPAAVVFHENRLCFGGTLSEPDTIWMSKIGSFFNFDVGEAADDDSINLVAATGDAHEIRYMISNRDLQVFTSTGELYVPTYLNQAITPTNAQIRMQTPYGISFVAPVSIDGATIFVQENGKNVREYLYSDSEDAYTASTISTLASHLIDNPKYATVSHGLISLPDSYAAFTSSNGDLVLFTSNRAEKKAAWTRVTVDGRFGSVIAIGQTLFANVYDSKNKLQLCKFSIPNLDFNRFFSFTSQLDVSFLYVNGDVVSVNGYKVATSEYTYLGDFTVQDVGGVANRIDLSAYSSSGYDLVVVGKKFTAKLVTNPFDASMGNGPATGTVRGITNVIVDVTNTISMNVNSQLAVDGKFTGKKEIKLLGYSRNPQVTIEQEEPEAMQVNGIVAELIV